MKYVLLIWTRLINEKIVHKKPLDFLGGGRRFVEKWFISEKHFSRDVLPGITIIFTLNPLLPAQTLTVSTGRYTYVRSYILESPYLLCLPLPRLEIIFWYESWFDLRPLFDWEDLLGSVGLGLLCLLC